MIFGELLTKYRKMNGYTITELAEGINKSRSYISKLENGHEKTPSAELINSISKFLSLSDTEKNTLLNSVGKELTPPATVGDISQKKEVKAMDENSKINFDIPTNMPVLFSNAAFVSSNENGIVINYAQPLFENNYKVVSRIGLTVGHAKSLIKALQEHINKAEEKEKES